MGLIFNLAIRIAIFYFLGEVLFLPDDPRFAGKAIPIRNLIIVVSLSLLFPLLYFLRKKWRTLPAGRQEYPFWLDNLYLSIFALDMAGNSFNLYDSYFYFDLAPHFHGTGAVATILAGAFGLSFLTAAGSANLIHTLLEAQEYYTDVLAKTHNVRGVFDTVGDLTVGILGITIYLAIYKIIKIQRR